MANACFRCATELEAGQTFCAACRDEVSLENLLTTTTGARRTWLLVAIPTVAAGCLTLVPNIPILVFAPEKRGLAIFMMWVGSIPFTAVMAYGLVRDAAHVRDHPESDWSPSAGSAWGLAVLSVAAAPLAPVVAAHYLWRRRAELGLPIRTGGD